MKARAACAPQLEISAAGDCAAGDCAAGGQRE
jgi:hypothetical protein